ncbi:VgrG-related protein [Chloroflexota bacterium]
MPQAQELISQMYLKIGGANVAEEIYNSLISLEVDDSLLLPDMFSIHLRDPQFKWADSDTFSLGKAVEISVKEGSSSTTTKILTGEITAIEPEFGQDAGPTVVIRGYDQSHRLHRSKKTKTYTQVTDGDIVKAVARDCGLKNKLDSTPEVHEYVCQDNQTDMEFLQERARRIGFRLYVEDGTLHFRSAPDSEPQVPVLEWGKNLRDFQARLTTAQQVTEVTVRGWDPKTKKEIIGKATTPQDTPQVGEADAGGKASKKAFNMESKEVITDRPVSTPAEADALAQSKCNEMGNAFIQAEGTCLGNPTVHAGAIVELKGIGKRFSGRYRITHALHRYDDSNYRTEFTVSGQRTNTLGSLLATGNGKKQGVVIGIVTNNDDPDGQNRVKVKFPTLLSNEESYWARLVSPMAGDGRGFEFIPEVNDEVLVAFEHDDHNHPFVLGSLWNGKDKPPQGSGNAVGSTGKVEKRTIRSRSGHNITLDDTASCGKISIVDSTEKNLVNIDSQNNALEVKAGSKVEIHTDDGHKITIDSSGIVIEAAMGKDLTLKGQKIKLEAMMDVEMTANSNVKIEGTMTTVKGKASMDIDGGAKLTAKGGIVMIN